MRPAFLLVLSMLSLQSAAYAETYYADLSIGVGLDGITRISGLTNHPALEDKTTSDLTNKKGSVWTFNLSLPKEDIFSDFVYEVSLPEGASVNYVKTTGSFRLSGRDDQIIVYGSGENASLSILVQYQIGETKIVEEEKPGVPVEYYYLGAIILFLIFGAAYILYSRKKEDKIDKFEGSSASEGDESVLSDRQKEIIQVLRESGKPINQTVICDKLNLPKSSVSRNIDSLERLGFLKKTRNGMSTMISLKK